MISDVIGADTEVPSTIFLIFFKRIKEKKFGLLDFLPET